MRISCLLREPVLTNVKRELAGHEVVCVDTARELFVALGEGRIDAIVIDASLLTTDDLLGLLSAFPRAPFFVYSALTPHMARVVSAANLVRHVPVLLFPYDSEAGRLRTWVEGITPHAIADAILHELEDELGRFPDRAQEAIVRLFISPLEFRTRDDLAREAAIHLRTLDRMLHRVRLRGVRELIMSARLALAYGWLVSGMSVVQVAARLQEKPATFRGHWLMFVQDRPARARRHLPEREFLRRVLHTLRATHPSSQSLQSDLLPAALPAPS